jgi:arylsulfatase
MRESGLIDETFPQSSPTYGDWHLMTEEERADASLRMAVYAAMTDRIDQNLARLIDYLKDAGDFDNTLIIFMSDNGASAELIFDVDGDTEIGAEHPVGTVGRWATLGKSWANVSNTPFRFYKNHSYEGGSASPMIMHWPDAIANPGDVITANTNLIDILPTLLAVAGAQYPEVDHKGEPAPPLEGLNLKPYLSSPQILERDGPVFQRWKRGRSARTERWKLLSYAEKGPAAEDGEWELYDMANDRTETINVADEHPDIVAEMTADYDAWLARVRPDL